MADECCSCQNWDWSEHAISLCKMCRSKSATESQSLATPWWCVSWASWATLRELRYCVRAEKELHCLNISQDGEVIDHFWIVSHHHRFWRWCQQICANSCPDKRRVSNEKEIQNSLPYSLDHTKKVRGTQANGLNTRIKFYAVLSRPLETTLCFWCSVNHCAVLITTD